MLATVILSVVLAATALAQTRPACPGARLAGAPGAHGTAIASCGNQERDPIQVLLFTKTERFRHDSIPDAIAMLTSLSASGGLPARGLELAARRGRCQKGSDIRYRQFARS